VRSPLPPSITEPLSDAALLVALQAGDEGAFMTLVDRHHASLVRLARTVVSSEAIAEEVAQEAWTGLLEGLARFEGRSSLKTWLFRILINRARTRGVREARTVPFSALESSEDAGSEPDPGAFTRRGGWASPPVRWDNDTPETLLLRAEVRACLDKAIAALPPNQRVVLTLRDVEGVDSADVCHVLEITETNQRVLLHRARGRVRAALAEYMDGDPA
jgi:RNA polymerase sigma-70 factor (ECF subfamily)